MIDEIKLFIENENNQKIIVICLIVHIINVWSWWCRKYFFIAVSIGYRAESDFNSTDKTPKSRLPESEIFTEI